jgi:hypothetical protein
MCGAGMWQHALGIQCLRERQSENPPCSPMPQTCKPPSLPVCSTYPHAPARAEACPEVLLFSLCGMDLQASARHTQRLLQRLAAEENSSTSSPGSTGPGADRMRGRLVPGCSLGSLEEGMGPQLERITVMVADGELTLRVCIMGCGCVSVCVWGEGGGAPAGVCQPSCWY